MRLYVNDKKVCRKMAIFKNLTCATRCVSTQTVNTVGKRSDLFSEIPSNLIQLRSLKRLPACLSMILSFIVLMYAFAAFVGFI